MTSTATIDDASAPASSTAALPRTADALAASRDAVIEMLHEADALLIDFNGTLSDDEELIADLVIEIARERLGVELNRDFYFDELVGHTEPRMFRTVAEIAAERAVDLPAGQTTSDATAAVRISDEHLDEISALFKRSYLKRVREQRRIDDAAEAFVRQAAAQHKSIAVVTAASKDIAVPALAQLELLEVIDAIVAIEDVERSKPEPDCYLLALELLGYEAGQALAFEDSLTGLASAQAAGLRTVGVGAGLKGLSQRTPYLIDRLVPELLR